MIVWPSQGGSGFSDYQQIYIILSLFSTHELVPFFQGSSED